MYRTRRDEINSRETLAAHVEQKKSLRSFVVNGVDLADLPGLLEVELENCLFLGCHFEDAAHQRAVEQRGAYIFPEFPEYPFNPYRHELYSVAELLEGYEDGGYVATRDFRIYEHFDRERHETAGLSIRLALAQRIHDHSIDSALQEFLHHHANRGVVGIMGGHSTSRSDSYYRMVAQLSWELTRRGYLVASGGGPGIMEAANLGAYLANFSRVEVLDAALEILCEAPLFDGGEREGTPEYLEAIKAYIEAAKKTRDAAASEAFGRTYDREHPTPGLSLAVPTWFYGHEPTNLFCDHVAKYFSNGLREDGLLAISRAGVIFAPGSAGTLQEVFMDLAQNHYATFVDRSPMLFLGRDTFGEIFSFIQHFIAARGKTDVYGDLVALFDDPMEIVTFIETHPPRPRAKTRPLYELV